MAREDLIICSKCDTHVDVHPAGECLDALLLDVTGIDAGPVSTSGDAFLEFLDRSGLNIGHFAFSDGQTDIVFSRSHLAGGEWNAALRRHPMEHWINGNGPSIQLAGVRGAIKFYHYIRTEGIDGH